MYILDYDEGSLFKQYSLHVVYLAFWTTPPEAIQTVYSCLIFPAWNGCIRNEGLNPKRVCWSKFVFDPLDSWLPCCQLSGFSSNKRDLRAVYYPVSGKHHKNVIYTLLTLFLYSRPYGSARHDMTRHDTTLGSSIAQARHEQYHDSCMAIKHMRHVRVEDQTLGRAVVDDYKRSWLLRHVYKVI
ncbi:hypothetical protein TorRG33x02_053410 [Trema orientale]|uniref:Uncharacterized protein n=1 Tax=Trema orientale TaxID=63057 RepID=A0A2P5FLS8_TREOI|nr:hypothetical protein TorRG33x02_053410 [Trema orientale]